MKCTVLCLIFLSSTFAETLHIGALSTAKSAMLRVSAGSALIVRPAPGASKEFVIYTAVHDFDGVLVAKENEDSIDNKFVFQPYVAGVFYVVLRNTSEFEGDVEITVETSDAGTKAPTRKAGFFSVRVFFATDRRSDTAPAIFYGGELDPSGSLNLGMAVVTLPRDHRQGELEAPSIWRLEFSEDPTRHVVLDPKSIANLPVATFYSQVSEQVSRSMGREVFVFVHGFNTSFSDAVKRTAQLKYDLGLDAAPITYSWSSQASLSVSGYLGDERNVDLSTERFVAFLETVRASTGARVVNVLAHSMGNRLIMNALTSQNASRVQIDQLILMAPDIDAARFRQASQQLAQRSRHITLYASSADLALQAAARLRGGFTRAGQGGQALVVLRGIDTIDASSIDTSLAGAKHQYYGDSTTIISDVFHALRGALPSERSKRTRLREQTLSSLPYWRFVQQ